MIGLHEYVVWIATGSQHLYGPEIFQRVEQHSRSGVDALNASGELPVCRVFKPVLTTPGAAPPQGGGRALAGCTFSPARGYWPAGRTLPVSASRPNRNTWRPTNK